MVTSKEQQIKILKFGFWLWYPQYVFITGLFIIIGLLLLPLYDLNNYIHENFLIVWCQISIVIFMVLEAIRNRKLILELKHKE